MKTAAPLAALLLAGAAASGQEDVATPEFAVTPLLCVDGASRGSEGQRVHKVDLRSDEMLAPDSDRTSG